MKISRHQIIAFAAVGREKSFSKAAKSLALGQSVITQHISALEQNIGTRLFIRSRTGSQLTTTGQELFMLADKLRVLEEQFKERANQYMDLNAGNLSICVSTPLPAMALISAFKSRYPGVEVDLLMAPWKEAMAMLRQRQVDIAIIMQPESLEDLYVLAIERQPFVAIVPKKHPLAARKSVAMNELCQETLILLGESSYTRYKVDQLLLQFGITTTNTLTTGSYEMMLEAVMHGLGISIALKGAQSRYQGIKIVPIRQCSTEHTYAVVSTKDKASLLTIKRFYEVARSGIRANKSWRVD